MKIAKVQCWGIIALLSLLGAELLADNMLLTWPDIPCWKWCAFGTGLIATIVAAITNRAHIHFKSQNIKDILLNLIKYSISKTPLDLLFILVFICHLAWIPDAFSDVIKDAHPNLSALWLVAHVGLYFVGLTIAVLIKPTIEKPTTEEPLVLITGISNGLNFELCTKPLQTHTQITTVVVFIDPTITVENIPNYSSFVESKDLLFNYIAENLNQQTGGNRTLSISFEECDYDNLKGTFDTINNRIEKLEAEFKDDHLLFNLTPGNKYISIALALNSIKGYRQYCYIKQSTKELETKTMDVFEVKDIFKELYN